MSVQISAFSPSQPIIRGLLRRSTAQSIPDTTATQVTFESSDYNKGGIVDLANNRFVIPRPGLYLMVAQLVYATNAVNRRDGRIHVNGVELYNDRRMTITVATQSSQSAPVFVSPLNAGDLITLIAAQDSGGALNLTSCRFVCSFIQAI